jgi:2-iminobutanoate/2-iminopropanoate deaminase
MTEPVSLARAAASLTETWSPRVVARLNDHLVKVAALDGAFVWHTHADQDELFLVLTGALRIDRADAEPVTLRPGEAFVVPRGTPHRPVVVEAPCHIALVEPATTAHTGEVVTARTRSLADQLAPESVGIEPTGAGPLADLARVPAPPAMTLLSAADAPAAVGPYSHAVRSGDLVFCSGQIGLDPASGGLVGDDAAGEMTQAMANVRAVLAEAGLTLGDVVKTTVFLVSMDDYGAVNTVYAEAFGDHRPARSAVAVAGLPLGARVEIEVVAQG